MRLMKAVFFISSLSSVSSLADNCVYDCPTGVSGEEIERSVYTLSNNATTKFADWVAYNVTSSTIDGPTRSRNFRSDPDIDSDDTLETGDYTGANAEIDTDRGHQVPLASFSNATDWEDVNYLSNITPQSSDLNQGAWVDLEEAVREYVRTGQDVYVVTGPLYESFFATLPGADESHTIPSGYFKVVMRDVNGFADASGFILEQDANRSDDYCATEVPIDEIESRSGLDIMPSLSSIQESAVEGITGGLTSELGCD